MHDDDELMAAYSDDEISGINEHHNQLAAHLSATDITINQP